MTASQGQGHDYPSFVQTMAIYSDFLLRHDANIGFQLIEVKEKLRIHHDAISTDRFRITSIKLFLEFRIFFSIR